jgi:type I restriction enzyme S subunit
VGNQKRFRKYPEYRDPSIEWLGAVPAHWQAIRMKYLVTETLTYGANEAAELTDTNLPRYIRITDINDDGSLKEDTFRSLTDEVAEPYLLDEGDLLLARSGATVGKSFLYQENWGRAAYAGYLIKASLNLNRALPCFVWYFTQSTSYWDWLRSVCIQATIQNVSAERYSNLVVPLPPLSEQNSIISFLNYEMKKSDALIAKKERLIELLKEQRTALITRAVTKGLDPTVPMKDSGIEWIGEIPTHWEINKMKREIVIRGGQVDPSIVEFGTMVLIAPNHVESKTGRLLALETAAEQGAMSGKYLVQEGDIIYCKIRPELVKVCIAPCDGLCSADMYALVPKKDNDAQFILYLLLSDVFTRLAVDESMRVKMPKINREALGEIILPFPDKEEQTRIATYIESQVRQIDGLVAKTLDSIEMLREYRTALISAAVTGQSDVGEEVA